MIRLHDMRSPADCMSTVSDPVDMSAVFSLATVGRERVIAGAAAHGLLKIFDLRMPGGRAYSYVDASASSTTNAAQATNGCSSANDDNNKILQATGTNIYTPRTGPGLRRGGGGRSGQSRQHWTQDSPVYSLSRPSPSSPKLYVGLENRVLDFKFTSAADPYPDPVFNGILVYRNDAGRGGKRVIDPLKTWDPYGEVLDMSMYEQGGARQTKLVYQKSISALGHATHSDEQQDERLRGYDERWHVVDNMRATAMLGGGQGPTRGRAVFFGGR